MTRTTRAALLAAVAAAGILVLRQRPEDPGDAPLVKAAGQRSPGGGDITVKAAAQQAPGGENIAWEPPWLARLAEWVPAAPRSRAGELAGYVWASPMTAAGLILGLISGARPVPRDGALLFAGARGPAAGMLRWRGFDATTLGHVVVAASADPSPQLWAHELVHVRQAERLGGLFAPLYLGLLGVYGYRRHPMERAARSSRA